MSAEGPHQLDKEDFVYPVSFDYNYEWVPRKLSLPTWVLLDLQDACIEAEKKGKKFIEASYVNDIERLYAFQKKKNSKPNDIIHYDIWFVKDITTHLLSERTSSDPDSENTYVLSLTTVPYKLDSEKKVTPEIEKVIQNACRAARVASKKFVQIVFSNGSIIYQYKRRIGRSRENEFRYWNPEGLLNDFKEGEEI